MYCNLKNLDFHIPIDDIIMNDKFTNSNVYTNIFSIKFKLISNF